MEKRRWLGRYLMAIYVALLSLPIFIGIIGVFSRVASGGEVIIIGYFILFALFMAIIYGLCLSRQWVEILGKYVYPFLVAPILAIGSFTLAALSGTKTPVMFIGTILFIFDLLFLIYIFPIVLYFYFDAIRRLSLQLKILLLVLCLSPVVMFLGYSFVQVMLKR